MAPRNTTGRAQAGSSTDSIPEEHTEVLANQQAEIERLTALLAAAEARAARPGETPSTTEQTMAMLTESIVRALGRPPESTPEPKRSVKIPSPAILTDNQDPTFESWKIQVQDKLRINSDHFPSEDARKAFVFACTGGDAQGHLRPRYSSDAVDPFESYDDMIRHLASIYEDPYKVQNARYDYQALRMKTTEKFTEFQTRFLQLAGQARISSDNLMPDLFDKLTLELRRTILPNYSTMTSLQQLTNQCRAVDQGLRRIKAEAESLKRNRIPTGSYKSIEAPEATTQLPQDRNRGSPPTSWRPRTATPPHAPRYRTPAPDLCYKCGQEGHYAKDCTTGVIKPEVALVHDLYEDSGQPASKSEEEVELEEPGKEQP